MKKYNFGEIYFIRERDYKTGKPSPFVKIGLVRYSENRDSFGRLAEHQTGNPRRLLLEAARIVQTEAVDLVEARLHQLYAKNRISGEWFEFSDDKDLQTAISAASDMAREVSQVIPRFEIADKLDREISNGLARAATSEEEALGMRLQVARKQVKACESLESDVKLILTKAVSEGKDISVAAKSSVKSYAPKFVEDDFKKDNEKLWESYLVETASWYHTFLPKAKAEDLGNDFEAEISRLAEQSRAAESSGDLSELVEVNLGLTNLKGIASWEDKVATTDLKISMGLFDELTGVCTWKRHWNPKTVFDSETFAAEHPDLAKKYVSTPEPKTVVKPKKGKA